MIFSSGMSRRPDFEAALVANHSIGIDIGEMSDNAMAQLAAAMVNSDAHVFVDSGAFAAFRAGMRGKPSRVDFARVFDRYDVLARAVCAADGGGDDAASRLHFVMPDVVGDQTATIEALQTFAESADYVAFGNPIVPLQAGKLSLVEFYDAVCGVLGVTGMLRVGIPSAEAAASDVQLVELLIARPDVYAVHILGAAGNKRAAARLEALRVAGFDGDVSMDANRVRGYWNQFSTRKEAVSRLLAGLPPKRRADLTASLFGDQP